MIVPEPYASLLWPEPIAHLEAKTALAARAAARILATLEACPAADRVLGVGSGSSVFLVLQHLAREHTLPDGVRAVATSYEAGWYAAAAGLELLDDPSATLRPALTFDGADAVNPEGALVKGRGGAMRRERQMLDAAAHQLIIVDASKRFGTLSGVALPLELDPMLAGASMAAIATELDGRVALRSGAGKDGPTVAESGAVLADVTWPWNVVIDDALDAALHSIPGVLETGYFPPSTNREVLEA